jgi:ABC-type methionine transport system permease subunit
MAYTDKFADSCLATAQMFLIAGGLTFVFGAVFGILLTVTRPGGIAENKIVYRITDDRIEIVDFWDVRKEPAALADSVK